jgi:hypothetical protein
MRQEQWCRELWLQALDLPAVSPPKEVDDVSRAIGPARAEQARTGTDDPHRLHEEDAQVQGRYAA